jgi:hypothetical protein
MNVMKCVIDIPDEIGQALEERASAAGEDMVGLIQMVLVSFVRSDAQASWAGRCPDPPLPAAEIVPPCDLPRTDPRPVTVEKLSQRRPDSIVDSA